MGFKEHCQEQSFFAKVTQLSMTELRLWGPRIVFTVNSKEKGRTYNNNDSALRGKATQGRQGRAGPGQGRAA